MATLHKFKQKDETIKEEPPSLHGRAMENLEFIRDAMQRSTEFTAVPGYGGALMGATAVGACIIAGLQTNYHLWLLTWLVEAGLALAIGLLAMWQKSKNVQTPLNSAPAKKFANGFVPPIMAGIILTALLGLNGFFSFLPCVWLTLYGTAVVTGGAYSVKAVPVMGWVFILLGAAAVFVPAAYGNVLMGVGFGAVHIVFGVFIGKNYGG
jgi:hypothetical protein